MATNELPEMPSDEDFAEMRKRVNEHFFSPLSNRVLRYLLAEHDAQPAPVAVPEDVADAARDQRQGLMWDQVLIRRMCDWILSRVPEPVVEWEPRVDSDGNTHWLGRIGGKSVIDVVHCLRNGRPAYRIEYGGAKEHECDLASAKRRAEDLCGVSTKKGG